MSSSTGSGHVLGEGSAGEAESVVERDGCGEREEAAGQARSEPVKGACAVAFEGQDVFGGPVDRLDALADRGQVKAAAGLVLAARAMDAGVQGGEVGLEPRAAEVLVADQREELTGQAPAALARSAPEALDRRLGDGWRAGAGDSRIQPCSSRLARLPGPPPLVP
jgi:hypothetical protein